MRGCFKRISKPPGFLHPAPGPTLTVRSCFPLWLCCCSHSGHRKEARMTGKTIDDVVVGDRAELTCAINADLVASFVTISGDRNPIHRDAEFAASTSFGEPIAPGILTAALVAAVIGSELPGPGAVYLSQSLKFLRPV